MGHVLESMYDMHADPTAISAAFNLHVPLIEIDDAVREYEKVTTEEIEAKKKLILKEFDTPIPASDPVTMKLTDADLLRSAHGAAALDRLIDRYELDGLAYYYEGTEDTIQREVATSFIVGNSILNAQGTPMCGEFDIKTCIAMFIMDRLDIGGSFAEFHPFDFSEDFILVGHDGPHHIAIANGKPILRSLTKFHGKPGNGASVEFKIKEAFTQQGGKIIYYSVCDNLKKIGDHENVALVDIAQGAPAMRAAASKFQYNIRFDCEKGAQKSPTMTVHKSNNATIFSVYNRNTTTDTFIKFPLGAPILDCYETEIVDGFAKYRFPRCEHKECRVFVKQKAGVVSVKEMPPVNNLYRRKISISGLEKATVYVFPEYKGAEKCGFINTLDIAHNDCTPVLDDCWELVKDSMGLYYKAENITGNYYLCMPAEKYI